LSRNGRTDFFIVKTIHHRCTRQDWFKNDMLKRISFVAWKVLKEALIIAGSRCL
jgi:hypothetical protein